MMNFAPPEHAEKFREEVREFLRQHLTPAIRGEMRSSGTSHSAAFHDALAERGWIAPSWPHEYGGQGRDPYETAVLSDELAYARAPSDALGSTMLVANTLLRVGTDEQKRTLLPRVVAGKLLFALGYSEADSGSDAAAARTRAVRAGDHWVITGAKIFTTLAEVCDFVFLLARTNPDASKHKGLTMFLVPLDAPGVEIRPIRTLGGERTNATFYDAVRMPDSARVGGVDEGWRVMTVALDLERGGGGFAAQAARVLDDTVRWARGHRRHGRPVLDDPRVRERLVRLYAEVRAARLLAYRVVWMQSRGIVPNVEASMGKLAGSEIFVRAAEACLDLLGPEGLARADGDGDELGASVEEAWRHSKVTTIYAGTSEIQRNIIALRGLGLPRA